MTENQRQFPRKEVQIEVALNFLEDQTRTVITRDISQGGLSLQVKNPEHYTMGEMVSVHYKNPLNDYTATEKDGIIVRHTRDGFAVAFVEIEDF